MHMHIECNVKSCTHIWMGCWWWHSQAWEPRTAGGEGAEEQRIAPCCPPAVVTWQALHLLTGTNTPGKKICDYPSQRRAIFTVSSSCMFLSGPHPPDALSLQEKRERVREGGRGRRGRPTCVEKNHSDLHMAQDRGSQKDERQRTEWEVEEERGVELGAQ